MASFIVPERSALLVIDMQYDFMPGGALAVAGGDEIIDGVNACMRDFFDAGAAVVITQDWHPPDHASFASAHGGKRPYDPIDGIPGIGPILWPDHCVQGTRGAEIHDRVDKKHAHVILRKGFHRQIDSYSAFVENDKKTATGLAGFLKERGIISVHICGLAFDYCVFYSAIDAAALGFKVYVFTDLSRAVGSPPGILESVSVSYATHGCALRRYLS
ncbi:MAG: bifunctional nicotinamidase/pyrazinamidase [Candidatus Sigynarchaeum springense]